MQISELRLFALLSGLLLSSCSQHPDTLLSSQTEPEHGLLLSAEIAETSGLVCLNGQNFLTVNDSGHSPTLYQLDHRGHVVRRLTVPGANHDWEALTIHQGELWIGDIGNNSGQRQSLQLYHGPLPDFNSRELVVATAEVRYPQPPLSAPAPYDHELDAEGLVSAEDRLLLFSKNWHGMTSRVYAVDTSQTNVLLRQVGETGPIPGLITDVAYSAAFKVFVVAGYQNIRLNPLAYMFSGDFSPFVALLDTQFNVISTFPVLHAGQIEALCLDGSQQIWLSQEQSASQPAKLWRFGNVSALLQAEH